MVKRQATTSDADTQRSIQSVEIGFDLVKALEAAGGPLTLKELAGLAGMVASKAHLYLVSFKRVGLVTQEPDGGRYALGPYALQLGLSMLRRLDIVCLAREPLHALSAGSGESVFLSVWSNRGPTIVLKVDGPRRTPMALQVGYVLPLLRSATGRIFLANLPASQTEELVREETRDLPPEQRRGLANLPSPQPRGGHLNVASTDSLLNDGFIGLSAPVFNHQNEIAAAVTIIGPRAAPAAITRDAQTDMLVKTTDAISRMLGAPTSSAAD
jgi:DNA-binding IclR family transcriptional regulator